MGIKHNTSMLDINGWRGSANDPKGAMTNEGTKRCPETKVANNYHCHHNDLAFTPNHFMYLYTP
jgi:hypothetical protein